MLKVTLRDAKAWLSGLVDQAIKGKFITITRHGKPVTALISIEAASIARKTVERRRSGLVAYLKTFPGGDFKRNRSPSRQTTFERVSSRYRRHLDALAFQDRGSGRICRMARAHGR